MNNYIKKIAKDFEIVSVTEKEMFTITKKNEKIIIYDKKIVAEMFEKKFKEKYKRILYILNDLLNNDDSSNDSDIALVIYDINNLRNDLLTKYAKYLDKSVINKYLGMLDLLDSKIELGVNQRGR